MVHEGTCISACWPHWLSRKCLAALSKAISEASGSQFKIDMGAQAAHLGDNSPDDLPLDVPQEPTTASWIHRTFAAVPATSRIVPVSTVLYHVLSPHKQVAGETLPIIRTGFSGNALRLEHRSPRWATGASAWTRSPRCSAARAAGKFTRLVRPPTGRLPAGASWIVRRHSP